MRNLKICALLLFVHTTLFARDSAPDLDRIAQEKAEQIHSLLWERLNPTLADQSKRRATDSVISFSLAPLAPCVPSSSPP